MLLLSDIITRFREVTLSNFGLDPLHYYTAPGLAWDAALKMSGIKLDLLLDPDHVLFFEAGIRGGASMISKQISEANNPYIPETYDNTKPQKYISLFDKNNLYGSVMMHSLPYCDFNFLNQEEIEKFDVTSITKDSDEEYVLECDLFYPPEIHELHNCYPLCAENRVVEDDEIAPHSRNLFEKLNGTKHKRIKTKKLIPNLYSKKNYIIHYRHLQLCLDLGLKIERIHRIMSFQQKP